MPVYRCTFFFGQANMGWSETWWNTRSNLNEAVKASARWLDHRNTCLSVQHSILACRVATEGDSSQSQLILPGRQKLGTTGFEVDIPGSGDYPESSTNLQYDQVRANLHNVYLLGGRRLSLRYMVGIPDLSSKSEAATLDAINPATWWLHWKNLHLHMMQEGWSIKCMKRGSSNPERRIRRWVTRGTPPDVVGVVVSGGNSLSVEQGDKVQVKGTRMTSDGIRTPNKVWHVEQVVEGTSEGIQTIYLRGSEGIDPSTIRILGTIRPVQYEFLTFDEYRPLRMGIHKRGKPFNSPAGRAKTKRYAA